MKSRKYVLAICVAAAILLCLAGVLYFCMTPICNDTPWFNDEFVYHVLRAARTVVVL